MCVLSQVLFDATLSGHFAMGTLCSTAAVASPPVPATVTGAAGVTQSGSPACIVDFVLRSRDLSASGDTMDTLVAALQTGESVRSITGYVRQHGAAWICGWRRGEGEGESVDTSTRAPPALHSHLLFVIRGSMSTCAYAFGCREHARTYLSPRLRSTTGSRAISPITLHSTARISSVLSLLLVSWPSRLPPY